MRNVELFPIKRPPRPIYWAIKSMTNQTTKFTYRGITYTKRCSTLTIAATEGTTAPRLQSPPTRHTLRATRSSATTRTVSRPVKWSREELVSPRQRLGVLIQEQGKKVSGLTDFPGILDRWLIKMLYPYVMDLPNVWIIKSTLRLGNILLIQDLYGNKMDGLVSVLNWWLRKDISIHLLRFRQPYY